MDLSGIGIILIFIILVFLALIVALKLLSTGDKLITTRQSYTTPLPADESNFLTAFLKPVYDDGLAEMETAADAFRDGLDLYGRGAYVNAGEQFIDAGRCTEAATRKFREVLSLVEDQTMDYAKFARHRLIDCKRFDGDAVTSALPKGWMPKKDSDFLVNPTGNFVVGGPDGDCGLTGRKIIVDTYGGYSRHGGGAFSGKDPTKVDRSAAYAARYVAKNIVAAGLADNARLNLPTLSAWQIRCRFYVDTHGTGKVDDEASWKRRCSELFPLRPTTIRRTLKLNRPIYKRTAAYGHFGRAPEKDGGFSWERSTLPTRSVRRSNKSDNSAKQRLSFANGRIMDAAVMHSDSDDDDTERRTGAFFGRRKGKKLRAGQTRLTQTLLPKLAIDLASPAPHDLASLFAHRPRDVRVEIGFGGAEHLIRTSRTQSRYRLHRRRRLRQRRRQGAGGHRCEIADQHPIAPRRCRGPFGLASLRVSGTARLALSGPLAETPALEAPFCAGRQHRCDCKSVAAGRPFPVRDRHSRLRRLDAGAVVAIADFRLARRTRRRLAQTLAGFHPYTLRSQSRA